MADRLTVFVPVTSTTPADLHAAIDAAFASHQSIPAPAPVEAPDEPIVLRVPEVARLLSLSETTVREMASRGELPSFVIGNARCFYRRALVEWVERQVAAAWPHGGGR